MALFRDFHPIVKYVKDNLSLIKRGENVYKSKHVKEVKYDPETKILGGTVQASMKDSYRYPKLSLINKVEGMDCRNCPKGTEPCSHKLAIFIFAHKNISCTDVPCQWNAPTGLERLDRNKNILISTLYPRKPYSALPEPPSSDTLEQFRRTGAMCGSAAAHAMWLLDPEPTPAEIAQRMQDSMSESNQSADVAVATPINIPKIEDVLFSRAFQDTTTVDKAAVLFNFTSLTEEQIHGIERATVGQSKNPLWHISRRHRITASNFALVLKGMNNFLSKRRKIPISTLKTVAGMYLKRRIGTDTGVRAIDWGRNHEEDAKRKFEEMTGKEIVECGIILDPSGVIGASPDGFIGNDEIFESKCPFKYRQSRSLAENLPESESYIIFYSKSTGEWYLNTNHEYYSQIQGQLHLSNRSVCWLTIWTPHDCKCVPVERQDEWAANLELLKKFYIDHYVPFILSSSAL